MNYGYLFTEKVGTHFSWIGEGKNTATNVKQINTRWETRENNPAHEIFTQKRWKNIYKAGKYLLTSTEICGLLVTCSLKPMLRWKTCGAQIRLRADNVYLARAKLS